MIVMDLEWNRGYDMKPIDEILQIGAVRTDETGAIRDTFSVYIRPGIHKKFDRGARSLPELEESKMSDISFPEAWGMFEAWRGGDEELAFWGNGDFGAVRQNCEHYGIGFTEPARIFDYQAAFSHVLGSDGQQAALWRAVEYLRIPDSFTFHNALNDAMYTALVGMWLGEDARYIRPPSPPGKHRKEKFCTERFAPKRGKRIGPFASREESLDSRAARTPLCPLCNKTMWVRQWHTTDDTRYYGSASCPDHGKFICRLTLDPVTKSGRAAIPELSPASILEYKTISRKGRTHVCASVRAARGRAGRYRRRKGRQPGKEER